MIDKRKGYGLSEMKRQPVQRIILLGAALISIVGYPLPAGSEPAMVLGEILRKTEAYYQSVHAFTAYFQQWSTSAAAGAITSEASGRLYYQKPRQMRWEYDTPEPQVFVANHDYAWLYVPSENQISLFDAKALFASPLAQAFFDGIIELKKNFEVSLDVSQSSQSSAVLKLIPKKEDPSIESLLLWIDMRTNRILRIDTRDLVGNVNRIVLDSQKVAPSLDAKLFQLEVPPSATIIDADGREMTSADIDKLKQTIEKQAK